MEETLISFETARLAKEKGFNIFQDSWYDKNGEECFVEHSDYCFSDYFSFKELDNGELITEEEIYSAPTQSLLQKWLRKKHELSVETFSLSYHNKIQFTFNIKKLNESLIIIISKNNLHYNSDEEALEAGLLECLKLI